MELLKTGNILCVSRKMFWLQPTVGLISCFDIIVPLSTSPPPPPTCFPQMSRVKVHSTTPTWSATNDLRTTRIRDTSRGEILLFKEIEWQTTRIEASADESLAKEALTPLRLIANQAKIRIVLKKRLSGMFEGSYKCSDQTALSYLWDCFQLYALLCLFSDTLSLWIPHSRLPTVGSCTFSVYKMTFHFLSHLFHL